MVPKENFNRKMFLVVTVPESIGFFRGQLTFLGEKGFEVSVVSSGGEANTESANFYPIEMRREISPRNDLLGLWKLFLLFVREKPYIVNAGTPKAGLLAMVAAYLARVPHRIYTFHGLRSQTLNGMKQGVVRFMERLSVFFSSQVICVSNSLKQEVCTQGISRAEKTQVINKGTCNGVDVDTFRAIGLEEIERLKCETLGVPRTAKIIGFVGRLNKDKGVEELIEAFKELKKQLDEVYLLICGNFEQDNPVQDETAKVIKQDPRVIWPGHVDNIVDYYNAMDVLVHPSYREGFGNVILEASSVGKPVIASRVTGCIDAVVDNVTGVLIPPRSSEAIVQAVTTLLTNPGLCVEMGKNGRERVVRDFSHEAVWSWYLMLYRGLR